jgi:hypothetical protein
MQRNSKTAYGAVFLRGGEGPASGEAVYDLFWRMITPCACALSATRSRQQGEVSSWVIARPAGSLAADRCRGENAGLHGGDYGGVCPEPA